MVSAKQIAAVELDLNEKVGKPKITIEWVLNMLLEHNSPFKEARGKGNTAYLYKTIVEFTDRPPYKFIMKIPTDEIINKLFEPLNMAESVKKGIIDEIKHLHCVECEVYGLLKDITDYPLAEVYYTEKSNEKTNGIIVMEDLSERATTFGIYTSITTGQCLNFARHLADFQSYVELKLDESQWRNKFEKNIHVRDKYDKEFRDGINLILDYNDDWFKFSAYCVQEKAKEFGTNNVMIKFSEDGSLSNEIAAFIDWQCFFEGNALFDAARYFVNSADAEIRREIESQAVDLYYDRLIENLRVHDRKPKLTREQAHQLYEIAYVHQTGVLAEIYAMLVLPDAKSVCKVKQAKAAKIYIRLRFALEDQQERLKKYNLLERFRAIKDIYVVIKYMDANPFQQYE
ncbi:hypothetical protein M3Y98_01187600 [Aphelenchoides besseyi]|nr:hypothetical protein M3Y98_01187600 [Aphelenchoides besseyi]